jgi:predicted HicB family RNase H-like nuclease
MPYTEAQKNATKAYLRSLKSLSIRISHEKYNNYSEAAKSENMSLRSFVIKAIEEKIEKGQN